MFPLALNMINQALAAVDPYHLLISQMQLENSKLSIQDHRFNLNVYHNIYLLGFGKAVAPMALAMEELLGDRLTRGAIIVKYGHGLPLKKTQVFEAGHPLPDENTLTASAKLLEIAEQAGLNDLVLVLISGGGSSLFEALPCGITLSDLTEMNRLLLASGATIAEINTVRKQISLVKGGRFAQRIAPAQTLALILSDVIGDAPESIASGPTSVDAGVSTDAWRIIEKYQLADRKPSAISGFLQPRGKNHSLANFAAKNNSFEKVTNIIIGNNRAALNKLAEQSRQNARQTLILTDRLCGDVQDIAPMLALIIKSALHSGLPLASPGCIILGGEPTVTVKGGGKGGRNQELVLRVLRGLSDVQKPFFFCSVGSDGTDGQTTAAGAWIDHRTLTKAQRLGLEIDQFLQSNDSWHFFYQLDQLIITGPTRTNVMDIMFCLI